MSRIATNESINLSDNYAVLLDETLRENRALRATLVERDEQNVRKIQDLTDKVDSLCQLMSERNQAQQTGKKKKGASKVHVPTRCRTEFRTMYKCLLEDDANFQGFHLEENASSNRNKAAFDLVVSALHDDHGGDQCPWSTAQLRGAYTTYLRSLKDTQKRRRTPGRLDHNTLCRRQGRLKEKIARREAAVDRMDWDERKKERCKKFLIADFTSSDESELSEDENGHDIKRFVTKRLPWEGSKLRELKDLLDLAYKKSLSPHLRKLQTERVVGETVSERGVPPDAPKWAVRTSSTPLATSTPVREGR